MSTTTRKRKPRATSNQGVAAEDLHKILPVTATVLRSFTSEKHLRNYRSMLYSINKQGTYRYRTIRAESEMWGILIWRMA